jgi:hypothetical protein
LKHEGFDDVPGMHVDGDDGDHLQSDDMNDYKSHETCKSHKSHKSLEMCGWCGWVLSYSQLTTTQGSLRFVPRDREGPLTLR